MQEIRRYQVRLLVRAKADMAEIEDYYINEGSKEVALKIIERITDDLQILRDYPWVGRPFRRQEQRLFPVYGGRYVAAYIIDEEKLLVKIVGLPRAESDWMRHLNYYFRIRSNRIRAGRK
ncbi:type II toxin-antitoxin system RelE/ParE family toxin [Sporomusa sphaeroides]|uniref:type II toxin-antitoxin system RelE/ParE family toxin n=1 Tax=Sporomusa sphaeroides TaxID=47679 RepID=UPI003DA0D547